MSRIISGFFGASFFKFHRMETVGFRVLFICVVSFAAFSCSNEDRSTEERLAGKWILADRKVDSVTVTLSECEMQSYIEFQVNNLCVIHDACLAESTNSGWSYQNGMLNISAHLPAAWYIDQLDDAVLMIRRNDISPSGLLQVTVRTYSRDGR